MKSIGLKIKEIRIKKGMSQEELASQSQVSPRTIQRLENDENEPRGKTMQLICDTLNVDIEQLLDFGKKEDSQFLMYFHLSVILGLFIPIGNIVIPLILWMTKKDKIIGLQEVGARLLNFQITFQLVTFLLILGSSLGKILHLGTFNWSQLFVLVFVLYLLNGIAAIALSIWNSKGKQVTYPSIIPLFR